MKKLTNSNALNEFRNELQEARIINKKLNEEINTFKTILSFLKYWNGESVMGTSLVTNLQRQTDTLYSEWVESDNIINHHLFTYLDEIAKANNMYL